MAVYVVNIDGVRSATSRRRVKILLRFASPVSCSFCRELLLAGQL
jgi:hypothetical protein